MKNIQEREQNFYKKYYGQLVGATITKFEFPEAQPGEDTDGWYEPFPTFSAVLSDGTKIILSLSRDPEGNGPGFLFIQEDK